MRLKLCGGEKTPGWAAHVSFPRPVLRAIVASRGKARLCLPEDGGGQGTGIAIITGMGRVENTKLVLE
jgi:hypothetical protein